jgi:hypothetical protein
MRILLNIIGALLAFLGVIWFLQGTNIMPYPPGGFMNGQTKWVINGAVAFLIGVILLVWANRKKRGQASPSA